MDQTRDAVAACGDETAFSSSLIRLCLVVFLVFLTVSLPLPVIPLFVRQQLGYPDWVVGCAVGIQFLATVLTRQVAGSLADRLGGHVAVGRGAWACAGAGAAYLAAAWLPVPAWTGLAVLIAGRLLLGMGESLCITGVLGWGIGLAGPHRSGRVMAWVGMAIYGALAAGAPVGLALAEAHGLGLVSLVAGLLPLAAWGVSTAIPRRRPQGARPVSFRLVLGRIWVPGLGLALQGVGFAVISAFVSLYFVSMDWSGAGWALTAFGSAFVAARLLGGGLPDRLGGARVAAVSLLVSSLGLGVLALAPQAWLAWVGAGLTGFGCSLVFPGLGLEVVRRSPPQARATALGAYAAFQDVAYGLSGPLAGLAAGFYGYRAVFWIGLAAALGGAAVSAGLAWRRIPEA